VLIRTDRLAARSQSYSSISWPIVRALAIGRSVLEIVNRRFTFDSTGLVGASTKAEGRSSAASEFATPGRAAGSRLEGTSRPNIELATQSSIRQRGPLRARAAIE
jgi:hypothetical protein